MSTTTLPEQPRRPLLPGDPRTFDQLKAHYAVERELADRLRDSSRAERCGGLYATLYDELFNRVPDHIDLIRHQCPARAAERSNQRLVFLRPFLTPDTTFMEIGAGDADLACAVAPHVRTVYAIEVSRAKVTHALPDNTHLLMTDGLQIPVAPASIDLAYSDQVIEHIHPDDVREHLENVRTALRPGGGYFCIWPNGLSGPHDISRYFDDTPRGLHMREYTCTELARLMRRSGLQPVWPYITVRSRALRAPLTIVRAYEAILGLLPGPLRTAVATHRLVRPLLNTALLGIRP